MCDPISIALAGASAVASGVSYMGEQATQDAQQQANDQWVAYQRQAAQNAQAQDTALRQQAEANMATTQQAVSPQTQTQEQQTQQGNLNQQFVAGTALAPNADPNRALLAGEGTPGSGAGGQDMTTDMASRITNAARQATGRIQALAGLASYGSGYGDVGSTVQNAITAGNQGIALTGDERMGVAKTLGVAQNVQPVQYASGQNLAGSIAGSLANLAGSAFGSAMRKQQPQAAS